MQRKPTSKTTPPAKQLRKGTKANSPSIPTDNTEDNAVQVPQSYGARAELVYRSVDGRSLMPHNYTSLPPDTTHYLLQNMVKTLPGAYSEMIGRVMAGSSLKSACTVIGINYNTLYIWLREGADDFYRTEDSYCARLFNDVRIATAHAVGSAEVAIHSDPKTLLKWLERGPGKQFHSDTGLWQPPTRDQQPAESPLDPLPLVDASAEHKQLDDDAMGRAIKHLEAINVSTTPEFAKQLREQYRIGAATPPPAQE